MENGYPPAISVNAKMKAQSLILISGGTVTISAEKLTLMQAESKKIRKDCDIETLDATAENTDGRPNLDALHQEV